MKFLPLLWSSLWRKKIRTIFTLASIFVAFLLFGLLMTIRTAFTFGVDIAGLDRLILIHKVSLSMPLPVSYLGRVSAMDGVTLATHQSWFGGVYQDPANFFAQMAVEPEPFMKMYPEFKLPPEQMAAWKADRRGAVVGVDLAKRFNWKIGDRIPSSARSGSRNKDKSGTSTSSASTTARRASTRRRCSSATTILDENAAPARAWSGGKSSRSTDASKAHDMSAKFDAMFANSQAETKTTTEKGFVEGFAKQMGDIGAIMIAITIAVLFTMILVAANTMAQSVRERTSEVGVLKTLGFSNGSILVLVLSESLLVAVIGGGLGLFASWLFVRGGDPTGGMLPIFMLPTRDVWAGVVLIVGLGLLAGLVPAVNAMNLKITDAH